MNTGMKKTPWQQTGRLARLAIVSAWVAEYWLKPNISAHFSMSDWLDRGVADFNRTEENGKTKGEGRGL